MYPLNLDVIFEEKDDLNDNDFVPKSSEPILFNQEELSDLIRDLNVSKESSVLLASQLNDRNLLQQGIKITFYRTRCDEWIFEEVPDFVFCIDIPGLLHKLGVKEYKPKEWRLFIDSYKRSLKCVLLHNSNMYVPIPVRHSTTLKDRYDLIKTALQHIKYEHHQWVICVDLKMVTFLLGQQSGYAKFPCSLCYWDSRDKTNHWKIKNWPVREQLKTGDKNVIHDLLIPREKIIFPPLHIKLELMKHFVKALDKTGQYFQYILSAFPGFSNEKLKACNFDGPQIRKLINDPNLQHSMNEIDFANGLSLFRVSFVKLITTRTLYRSY